MKKKLLLIFAFLTLVSHICFAADSRGNRGNKTFFIGNTPVSVQIASLLAHPYTIGIYLRDNFSIGLETGSDSPLYRHSFEIDGYVIEPHSESSGEDKEETISHAVLTHNGIYMRYFFGNSFNYLFAVNQRIWKGNVIIKKKVTGQSGILKAEAEIEVSAMIATVGIGNQWLIDNGLTIGADWLVISNAFSQSVSSNIKSNTGINATVVENEIVDLGNVLGAISTSPGLFVLTIGWSF